jgi:two-component system nitrogen regulation response regulator NtrX
VPVDVRVIAATNKRLDEEIARGTFREDLYYRLKVIPFRVPPLRERAEDIPLLVRHFLADFAAEYGRRPKEMAPAAVELLAAQPWPGNVRELHNVIERLVIMVPGERIEARHLPESLLVTRPPDVEAESDEPRSSGSAPLAAAREEFEKRYIWRRYKECGGNMSRTAEALGVERSNLYRKMRGHGLLAARRDGAGGDGEP